MLYDTNCYIILWQIPVSTLILTPLPLISHIQHYLTSRNHMVLHCFIFCMRLILSLLLSGHMIMKFNLSSLSSAFTLKTNISPLIFSPSSLLPCTFVIADVIFYRVHLKHYEYLIITHTILFPLIIIKCRHCSQKLLSWIRYYIIVHIITVSLF